MCGLYKVLAGALSVMAIMPAYASGDDVDTVMDVAISPVQLVAKPYLDDAVKTVDDKVAAVESSVTSVAADVDAVKAKIATAESGLETVTNKGQAIESSVTSVAADVDAVKAKIATAESGLETVTSKVQTMESQVGAMTNFLANGGTVGGKITVDMSKTASGMATPIAIKTTGGTYDVAFETSSGEDAIRVTRAGRELFQVGYVVDADVWYLNPGASGRVGSAAHPLQSVYTQRLYKGDNNNYVNIPSVISSSTPKPTLTAAVTPTTAGTYTLKMTVNANGSVTTNWVK